MQHVPTWFGTCSLEPTFTAKSVHSCTLNPALLVQELLQKHIAPHLIDEAIQAFFGGALRMKPAVLSLAHEMLGAGDLQLSSGGRHCEGAEDEPDLGEWEGMAAWTGWPSRDRNLCCNVDLAECV